MIRGKFINDNIPIVKVLIISDRSVQTPNFILDTGFTGDLQVTEEVAKELGLEMDSIENVTVANGEVVKVPMALAYSTMEGIKRVVSVLISKNVPLVGISFLKKFSYKAVIDCKNKKVVLNRVK